LIDCDYKAGSNLRKFSHNIKAPEKNTTQPTHNSSVANVAAYVHAARHEKQSAISSAWQQPIT